MSIKIVWRFEIYTIIYIHCKSNRIRFVLFYLVFRLFFFHSSCSLSFQKLTPILNQPFNQVIVVSAVAQFIFLFFSFSSQFRLKRITKETRTNWKRNLTKGWKIKIKSMATCTKNRNAAIFFFYLYFIFFFFCLYLFR